MCPRKILVCACLATTAILGALPSAASADFLRVEGGGVATVTGSPILNNGFSVAYGNVSCSSTIYTGTASDNSAFLDVTPSYSGCTLAGLPAVVNMNGCTYRLWVLGAATFGEVDILCPAGKSVQVIATAAGVTKCTVDIPGQSGLSSTNLSNTGTGTTRQVNMSYFSISTMAYTQTSGTGVGVCTNTSQKNGKITGSVTFTGETGFTHKGIYLE
jgi:hypothetical protein